MFWLLQGVLLQYAIWYHLCSQCDCRGAGWVPLLLSLQCCSAEHLNHLPEPVSDKPPIGGLGSEVPLNGVLCWKERKWSMTADHKLYFRRLSLTYQLWYWPQLSSSIRTS